MTHIVRNKPWGIVDLVVDEHRVFFQQKWFYHWLTEPGAGAWTTAEKRHFHNTLDRQIWAAWSNRLTFRVSGTSRLAQQLVRTGVSINFDVRWVLSNGHWDVHARKLPAGGSYRSNVIFARRIINLDSEDLEPHGACQSDGGTCRDNFLTVPHEFGHSLGYLHDEYNGSSPHYADTSSIMNIGTELRNRHLQMILDELNDMVPGCTFSLPPT